MVEQTKAQGFLRIKRVAGEDHFFSPPNTDGARQLLGATTARHDAAFDFGETEACVVRGNDKVTR